MALVEEKISRNKCIICGSHIEKSNFGSVCNPCKDSLIKPRQKKPKQE